MASNTEHKSMTFIDNVTSIWSGKQVRFYDSKLSHIDKSKLDSQQHTESNSHGVQLTRSPTQTESNSD